jgi:flagellar assembly protein FliH
MTRSSSRQRNVPPPAGAGAAGAKAAIYARFIPREELSSFAAWSPGDLAGAGPAPASSGAAAAAEPATPVDPVQQQAEAVKQARQSGYQDGYRDGLVALEGFKQSFAHQATLQVGQLVKAIGGQLDAMQQEMAEALAATALALARQIVRSELAARPESVAAVAQEALETLMLSARHITLRVHPDDQPLIAEGAGELLAARGARLVADIDVARGGCVVESNIGLVDASIETRWRRAAASIGRDEPWLPAPEADDPGAAS